MTSYNPDNAHQSLLEFAVEQSRVIFYIAERTENRRFKFISANIENVTGHKVSDVIAEPDYWWRFIHPDDAPDFERILQNLPSTLHDHCEFRYQTAAGEELWLRAELTLNPDSYVNSDDYSACLTDITRQKQTESALREAQQLLSAFFDHAPLAMNFKDTSSRYQMVNKKFTEWFGMSAEQVSGKTMYDFYEKDYADAFTEVEQQEVLKQRQTVRRELRVPFADGTVHPMAVVKFPVFDADGFIRGIGTYNADITMHKKLEAELRDSHALVQQVLEACPVPITVSRLEDGIILYESPAAQALLKYQQSQVGQSVIPRWVDLKERRSCLKHLSQTRAIDGVEVRYQRADGEQFWCSMSARLIEFRGEEVIVANLFDMTGHHAIEAELSRQREMLHRSEKLSALGELLASVAHELNNPLSVVTGQTELLQETSDDPRIAARARKIGNAAERCGRIVNTFLAMARQRPTESRPLDLNDIVTAALEVTAYTLRSSDIEVVLDINKELAPVYGDADQLSQVMINLIVNAQQALEDQPKPRQLKISTSIDKRRQQVILSVKDNGPGIPPEIRTRIFEPFFTTKQVGKGTGVGLALCHRIIESHDGCIEADKNCDQGAAFIIRLPAIQGSMLTASPEAPENPTVNAMLKVLVIDDEAEIVELLSDILQNTGCYVESCYSGNTAIVKIARQDFDLILSDLRMPGLDGPGLYRFLQQHRPDLLPRIAFMTGDTLGTKVRHFLDSIERPCLEKPFTPRQVRELLSRFTTTGKEDTALTEVGSP